MKLTSKGRYALQAVLDMIKHSNGRAVKLSDIADRQQISVQYLAQLFRKLQIKGVIVAQRGPGGGYLLKGSPEKVTAEQVLKGVGEDMDYNHTDIKEDDTAEKKSLAKFTESLDLAIAKTLSISLQELL